MTTAAKFLLLAFGLLLPGTVAAHEWCEPDTVATYAPSSPVITNVTFATIDRSSAESDKELYAHTLLTADVNVGETYPFSMSYTLDLAFCPQYAIRVWIDWNHDESFDEPGDLVVTRERDTLGSVFEDIEVPPTATPGLTRMRVAMKMDTVCGHDPIAACPEPEAFDWHGEIEDYNLIVIPSGETDCSNGTDDDGDGLVDCEDSDCVWDPLGDCDGDGEPNETDCAAADPGAFALPPEVALLLVGLDPLGSTDALLTWTGLAPEAGLATVHDVVTGRLSDFGAPGPWARATCLAMDEAGAGATDARLTGRSAEGYWYLVRGENSCGLGTLGVGSLGEERFVSALTCQ